MIKGVSDIRRLPRLGKIRLGEKAVSAGGNPYPKALDYFNCPPEVQAVYGEKPRVLDIMFPVEDQTVFFSQWYKRYGKTTGLVCKGDGVTATQIDHETGEMIEMDCTPDECEWYGKKHCRRLANLQFLLPKVPGLGVWQIDSTSFFSIVNINSGLEMIRAVAGKVSMLPLQLILKPQEVTPDGKKKTVFVLDLMAPVTLGQLLISSQKTPVQLLMPTLNEDDRPEDLYPDGVLANDGQEEGQPFDLNAGAPAFDLNATEEPPPPTPPRQPSRQQAARTRTQAQTQQKPQEAPRQGTRIDASTLNGDHIWDEVLAEQGADPIDSNIEAAFDILGIDEDARKQGLAKAGANKQALLDYLNRKIDAMNADPAPAQEPQRPAQTQQTRRPATPPPPPTQAPAQQPLSFF